MCYLQWVSYWLHLGMAADLLSWLFSSQFYWMSMFELSSMQRSTALGRSIVGEILMGGICDAGEVGMFINETPLTKDLFTFEVVRAVWRVSNGKGFWSPDLNRWRWRVLPIHGEELSSTSTRSSMKRNNQIIRPSCFQNCSSSHCTSLDTAIFSPYSLDDYHSSMFFHRCPLGSRTISSPHQWLIRRKLTYQRQKSIN